MQQAHLSFNPNVIDAIFTFFVHHREQVIASFKIFYLFLIVLIIVGGYSAYQTDDNYLMFYDLAGKAGEAGLVFYILTTIPGSARRFGLKHKLVTLLMIFRRYNGISMFLSVLAHFTILEGARWLRGLPNTLPPFEFMGLIAIILTSLLFVTSNDFSVHRLKKGWNRIHQLTYIIIWCIMLHVALQGFSLWSFLIGIALTIQIASFLYSAIVIHATKSASIS